MNYADVGVVGYASPRRSWALLVSQPLALIWLGFCLVSTFVVWRWGRTGWPLGSYWWDDLALSGGVQAIRSGLMPTVDFWAPFILPLYLKLFAQNMVGVAAGYAVECLLQGGGVLILLSVLLGRAKHPPSVYFTGIWAVALAMLPFNLGTVAEAQLGSVAYSGSYNRFGGALIALVLMLPVVRRDLTRDPVLVCWLAAVFALAFFIKVTIFQITFTICLAHAVADAQPGWRSLFLKATLLSVVASLLVLQLFDGGVGYLSALRDMSELRVIGMLDRLDTYRLLLAAHRIELFVLVYVALLVAIRNILLRRVWVGRVSCYLIACGLIVLYTLTNVGDNGLAPAVAAMHGLLFVQRQEDFLDGRTSAVVVKYAHLLRRVTCCIWVVFGSIYVGLHAYYSLMFLIKGAERGGISIPVATNFFAQNHVVDEQDWIQRTPILNRGDPVDAQSPRPYAAYMVGLDEAVLFLTKTVPDRSRSVYALDFPAYVFSLVEGYRVPRHSYPWLLYGHELTIDLHPAPTALLRDVDVLLVSKCSLAAGNRRFLAKIYRLELEANWRMMAALTCWDVYERK